MAILRELVEVLARVTNLPEATVFAYGRFAREAGLIAQKGRGRAAAQMNTKDAAQLLIALGGTSITRDAGIAAKAYGSLPGYALVIGGKYADPFEEYILDWLGTLGSPIGEDHLGMRKIDCDFEKFVDFLLQQSVSGGLTKFLRGIPVADLSQKNWPKAAEEFFRRGEYSKFAILNGAPRKPSDQVLIGSDEDVWFEIRFNRVTPFVFFEIFTINRERLFMAAFRNVKGKGKNMDLSVEATITQTSIQALGAALSGIKIPAKLTWQDEIDSFLFAEKLALNSPDRSRELFDIDQAIRALPPLPPEHREKEK